MANLQVEPPPILPVIEEDLKSYLLQPERLPIHRYEIHQQFWDREPNPKELLRFDGAPLSTTLKVQRDSNSGEIIEFREALLQDAGANAMNSTSLNRAPAKPSEATRGNAMFIPFWPGSFPDPIANLPDESSAFDTEFLTIPPGFKNGINFDTDGRTILSDNENKKSQGNFKTENVVNILEMVQHEQDLLGLWEKQETKKVEEQPTETESQELPEESKVLPNEPPVLQISTVPSQEEIKSTEWAILLDTTKPINDFKERIPEMAYNFEFELDTFQKLAILHLEKHDHVFVAAHTSAGKTVVAEYAIALSQRHMTRTVYTSPIKALSNQKYRDFKRVFKDVGLITGDFQINPTAACLIMTTEILRSMLYCGSDITRDLEYVIFDEVHYINDRERGHVWEQVLILLPKHVCVVLLSATVPNTVEFADWLGRTHQKKVYVITTPKRPVPLKHYLYTGMGGGSRDNRYLVLDDAWIQSGYIKAIESLKPHEKNKSAKEKQNSKDKFHREKQPFQKQQTRLNPKHEADMWRGLIDHLKRHDLLPVVAFIFSRAKCDQNSENLKSLDLTTAKEKSKINLFYDKCIRSLKESDRNIRQVVLMKDILNRGIGVHHSGVLPIIKEIVEMLFQHGLIKLLFATETFAMGVNMPARTVIFDSLSKHDGQEKRLLKPAEYIQMAGRAGRRGLDAEGTVIILCKNNVLVDRDLQKVMMGKPSQLESQFRLTYGMVLSLLRVESITVEGMMLRSFREADHQRNMANLKKEYEEVQKKIEEWYSQELSNYLTPLVKFFECANSVCRIRGEIIEKVMTSAKVIKALTPGRVILVTHKHHVNKLGLLLTVPKTKKLIYDVLVLTENTGENHTVIRDDLWYKMVSLATEKVFCPTGSPGHKVLTISSCDIMEITSHTIKVDTERVLKDWQNRQIERFRHDPPGQSCSQALQELHKLTLALNTDSSISLEYLHLIKDLKVNDKDLFEELSVYYRLKDRLIDYLPGIQIPNFEQQFLSVYERKSLEERKKELEFQLSNASLVLYKDYEKRIQLLRDLGYIDRENRVQLKGRVACEMGMNELLITELVLKNILKNLQPAEVAALLSSLVYRVKSRRDDRQGDENDLTPNLKTAIVNLKAIHQFIANKELKLEIATDEFQDDLNFEMVKIVYDWALSMSFAEIMEQAVIQEGIIVRCIQQLNETICDVRDAARIIGDPELQSKMEETSAAIKRDIVFAASLYTQGEASLL